MSARAPCGSIKNLLRFKMVRKPGSFILSVQVPELQDLSSLSLRNGKQKKKINEANMSLYEYVYQVNGILVQKAPYGTSIFRDKALTEFQQNNTVLEMDD